MMYDDKLVIVEMDTMTTYGFAEKGETADEAIQRANQYYTNDLKHLKASLQESKDEKRKQFLQSRIRENEVKIQAGFQVMETNKFQKIERERILSDKLKQVTEREYEDALNVLPPLNWCNIDGVEMFCMSERYIGTYTTQYAHNYRTGKYYCKMVDCMDKSTWIHHLLRE